MFASEFRRACQEMADAQNDVFGEPVTITPVTGKPNMQAQPDPTLQPFCIVAVYVDPAHTAVSPWPAGRDKVSQGASRQRHDTAGVISSRPHFSVAAHDLPYPVRPKYQIQRSNGELFEVIDCRFDGQARWQYDVVRLGRPSDQARIGEASYALNELAASLGAAIQKQGTS